VNPWSGDCREVNDGIRAGKTLGRLAELGQIDEQRRSDEVDSNDVMPALAELADNRAAGLSARTGDDDLHVVEA
jgi:hypothetical protein